MPNLTDRQQKLLDMLHSRVKMSNQEVKQSLSVSAATVSRDIHALVLAGEAIKTDHGIKLAPPPEPLVQERKCFFCGGTVNDRTIFIIQMEDGCQQNACCPHCGLMAIGQPGTQSALTRDFIYGRMVNARQTTYVLGSTVSLCCEPSVLGFLSQEEALHFQTGFGGRIFSLDEVLAELKKDTRF